jgi:hypothetical protein
LYLPNQLIITCNDIFQEKSCDAHLAGRSRYLLTPTYPTLSFIDKGIDYRVKCGSDIQEKGWVIPSPVLDIVVKVGAL